LRGRAAGHLQPAQAELFIVVFTTIDHLILMMMMIVVVVMVLIIVMIVIVVMVLMVVAVGVLLRLFVQVLTAYLHVRFSSRPSGNWSERCIARQARTPIRLTATSAVSTPKRPRSVRN
jgi:hypothetical protein